MAELPKLKKSKKLVGKERDKLKVKARRKYDTGVSIRSIAQELGRSYGFAHKLLEDSGVEFRERGSRRVRRLSDEEREQLAAKYRQWYEEEDATIAEIAAQDGRREGFVYRLLLETGVTMRPPVSRRKTADDAPALKKAFERPRRFERG